MSGLSEISILFAKHVGDIERARDRFTSESRRFVADIVESLRIARPDPWASPCVRIAVQPEPETEAKVTGYLHAQYALGRAIVRFKKSTNFVLVAEIRFGILCDENESAFCWKVDLVPAAKYTLLDDVIWREWKGVSGAGALPGGVHQARANVVCFTNRLLTADLCAEVAFGDVKQVFEFLLSTESALAEAIGLDMTAADEASQGSTG